ncbi:hypothetical protein CASFOL_020632 [Castilleja foliolosa]|uniref:Protein RER1 n=1 Tax=Castilleja foliolosa TaxID=1961234 RepID=A0ABD3D565_9LAMI
MGRVYAIKNRLQYYSDKLKGQFRYRWISTFVLACFYGLRVYLHGYYILVTFIMGLVLSSCMIFFLTSVYMDDDPDQDPSVSSDAPPLLPIKASDELRPFVPMIPELRFWWLVNTVLCVGLSLTFFPRLNLHIPVAGAGYFYFGFWILFNVIMLIDHRRFMIKHKFFPFYYGDKKNGDTKGNDLLLVERGGIESAVKHFKLIPIFSFLMQGLSVLLYILTSVREVFE